MQSSLQQYETSFHVAVIMDGNGRWATRQGRPRVEGHHEGSKAVRRTVEAAPGFGITVLTLYAFSSDNWHRPGKEVGHLMKLFYDYLYAERESCIANGVRLSVIGRRDRLSFALRTAVEAAETATIRGQRLHLRIAIDYSSRDNILRAACRLNQREDVTRETFSHLLAEENYSGIDVPDVDLLIRTGGEKRLSDFMLWESAYAEFFFTERMWPDFDAGDLKEAVDEFHQRSRRFGAISTAQS